MSSKSIISLNSCTSITIICSTSVITRFMLLKVQMVNEFDLSGDTYVLGTQDGCEKSSKSPRGGGGGGGGGGAVCGKMSLNNLFNLLYCILSL